MKFIVKKLPCFKVSALFVLLASMASSIHAADPGRPIKVTNMNNDTESFSLPEQVIQLSETFRSVLEAVADQDKVSLPNQYYQTMNELKSILFEQPVLVAFETDPTSENTQEVRYLLRSLKLEKRIKLLYLADHLNMPNLLALATDMVAQMMVNPGILHNILPNQQPWQAFTEKYSTLYQNRILSSLVAQALLRDLPTWKNLWKFAEIGHFKPGEFKQIAIGGDGQTIVLGYEDGLVRIVNSQGELENEIARPDAAPRISPEIAVSSDSQHIVIGYNNGLVRIINRQGVVEAEIIPAPAEDAIINGVAISGNGQHIVIGYENGQVRIVNSVGNTIGLFGPVANEFSPKVAISGDGQRIVIGYWNGLVHIIDPQGRPIDTVVRPEGANRVLQSVATNYNGQRIVIGYENGQVRIVDGQGILISDVTQKGDTSLLSPNVAISDDGQRIVIGYRNGRVRILDDRGFEIDRINGKTNYRLNGIAITSDGQCIIRGFFSTYVALEYGLLVAEVQIFKTLQPNLSSITLQQAQLITAILQHVIGTYARPPHLVPIFNDIPEEIRNRLMQ